VSRSVMIDEIELAGTVFSGLSALVIEDVKDAGGAICVRARTRGGAVACPGCGAGTARVHGYHERTAADVPVDGRRVLVRVRVRRMRCPDPGCPRQTFREQVPGVLDRYQRRTTRLTGQVSAVARALAGRAGARLLPALGITGSRHTALRALLQIPLPALAVPRVLGTGDFALRRGLVYATVLIDAETGRRVDVIPGRTASAVDGWLRDHPGVQVVCRDGSGAYGEAVRRALPGAVQVSDRWHLWHGLGEAVLKEVAAHCACWAGAARLQAGKRAETTLERWQQVHDLLGKGAGLLECARRLDLAVNTVKRYARARHLMGRYDRRPVLPVPGGPLQIPGQLRKGDRRCVHGDEHLARPGGRRRRLLVDQLLGPAASMRPQRHHGAHRGPSSDPATGYRPFWPRQARRSGAAIIFPMPQKPELQSHLKIAASASDRGPGARPVRPCAIPALRPLYTALAGCG
jgi:Transposase/zinc-finger of transposase IS204/IS1001/IS1096/IS1165